MLEDLVKEANANYNGKYLFSGTQTTPGSISNNPPGTNHDPFELITEAPTASNPSGLRVIFKGNTNDRTVQTDKSSTEVINTKATDIFGTNGEDLFKPIVDLYNVLTYNSDGSVRQTNDTLTTGDVDKIGNLHSSINDLYNNLTSSSATNGSKINRLQAISDQLSNQNLNLDGFRSSLEDTDVAKTSINLQQDNIALQYSLQVGSKLMSNTLFDFLTL
jgi:flagellin-like hook-associated protein FlgL